MEDSKLVIVLTIPSLQAGGMERVMSELIGEFVKKASVELHLILYGKSGDEFYQIPNEVRVHRPNFEFEDRLRLFFTIKTIIFLRNKIRSLKPHTILSFGEVWNSFVLLSLFGLPYPVFVSDRCQPDKRLRGYHEKLRSWMYARARGIIVQTDIAKRIYSEKYNHRNVIAIGNPIRSIEHDSDSLRENIVLSVGRLIATKHHDRLIEIFAKLNRPGWKLVIVGGNAQRQNNMSRLKDLIKSLNMVEKIILTGTLKDVDSYYKKSKIFAFTSSSEGFPNVIGEALSAGLPTIAYNCMAGPSDMIVDGLNGHLVDLFDDDAFAVMLAKLMDNEGYRLELAKNTNSSIQRFSKECISEKFYNVICESH